MTYDSRFLNLPQNKWNSPQILIDERRYCIYALRSLIPFPIHLVVAACDSLQVVALKSSLYFAFRDLYWNPGLTLMDDRWRPYAPRKRAPRRAQENSMHQYLTNRQQQILDYITREIDRTGVAPLCQQIASACEIHSLNVVSRHLKTLEQKGWITSQAGEITLLENVRSYRLTIFGNVVDGRVMLKRTI